MKIIPNRLLLIGAIGMLSCTSASTDDLVEPVEIEDFVTYTEHVQPIIEHNCVVCHANPPINAAPMSLTTYEFVKNAVETRGLLDRIQREQGESGAMPLGGPRLPQDLIDVIVQWKAEGLRE